MTIVEVRHGIMYFVNAGPFEHVSNPYAMVCASLWLSGMYVTLINVFMQFLYRYNVLCMTKKWSKAKFLFIYVLALIYSFCHGFAAFICFDQMDNNYTRILKTHPMYTWNTPAYTAGDPRNLRSLLHFVASQAIVTISYIFVIFMGKAINRKLMSECMSKKSLDAQQKLTKVMILQAVYPGVVVGLPIFVATICTQLRLDNPLVGLYCVTSISLIPIVNSVTVLLVITSFRRRILNFFPSGKKNRVETTANSSGLTRMSVTKASKVQYNESEKDDDVVF